MDAPIGQRGRLALAAIVLLAVAVPSAAQRGTAESGASLFLGDARFANGGPPCGACHRLSSLGFPNGGTVGPDLSPAYQTLGPEGVDLTLKTLFFPTMMPLYDGRPLTGAEQDALRALLQQAPSSPTSEGQTPTLAALAAAGFVALLAVAWLAGRRRLLGVRAPLVRARRPLSSSHEVDGGVRT